MFICERRKIIFKLFLLSLFLNIYKFIYTCWKLLIVFKMFNWQKFLVDILCYNFLRTIRHSLSTFFSLLCLNRYRFYTSIRTNFLIQILSSKIIPGIKKSKNLIVLYLHYNFSKILKFDCYEIFFIFKFWSSNIDMNNKIILVDDLDNIFEVNESEVEMNP